MTTERKPLTQDSEGVDDLLAAVGRLDGVKEQLVSLQAAALHPASLAVDVSESLAAIDAVRQAAAAVPGQAPPDENAADAADSAGAADAADVEDTEAPPADAELGEGE